jgi:CubicO group peptidase (beta-lactamase class C family)
VIPDGVQLTTDLDDLLATLVTDGEPGLSVGVYSGGALVAAASAGLALVEHGVPLTSHSVFDIASKSKHFTAVCVLVLVRDGRLDLDADIRGYLPELDLQHPVTLRHCLTHTGGLREYLSLCDIAGVPQAGMREDRMLALIAGQRELNYPLGSSWSYANTGYRRERAREPQRHLSVAPGRRDRAVARDG